MWGIPCSPREVPTRLKRSCSIVCHWTEGGVFGRLCFCLSNLSWYGLFTPLLWRSSSSSFQNFFRGKWSIYSCRFGMSAGGAEFRIFLCDHFVEMSSGSVYWTVVFLEWEKSWVKSIFFSLLPTLNICQRWLILLIAKSFSSPYYTFANKWINSFIIFSAGVPYVFYGKPVSWI